MAVIQKTLFAENLERYNTFVRDTNPTSTYFNITELPDTFTGGKNAFLIAGSGELVPDTLIKIEIKDAAGNVIYHEPGEGNLVTTINGEQFTNEYFEGVSKVVAVYVYPNDTAYGPCTITILGELSSYYDDNGLLTPIPIDWQGTYNVKWQKTINVNPTLANTTKIRFYRRPTATITELISPIYRIDSNTGLKINSGINQSFANIKISNLETFAGDVKRIKVFRTSLGDISDYDMIQDILVESKELLTTYNLSGSVVGNTGIFTSETLKNYWISGSLGTELTSSRVESGLKLSGSGYFRYSSSLELNSANTYELNLDAFYSASTDSNLGIYVSGSDGGDILIGTLSGISPTKNLLDTTIPFKLDSNFASASLYFSQSRGEWHVGNISLKLSEDTAFSPDEVSFVTTMPTVVGNEDFNFKFEFYDVNNNYVPVSVTGSANFTGGSNAITKLLTFESDRTAFRFSSGSVGNPPSQFVKFKTTKTNYTGSITYSSASFDKDGNYIVPSSYAGEYPGALTNVSDSGALLSIAKFSGSVSSVIVGSITYTASCEGFEEYETIYRFEDGDNAPGVFVTSNANQFIYKATDLSLNPTGQVITIEAKRKNLASATTPLTVNSGSGTPPLTFVSTNATNGVDTFTLAGSTYSYSIGERSYFISGSDQFGNEFSDAIKITPVKILDGLSVTLTNDNASLPALSNGFVASGSFILTSGSVNVKVGNETITFDDDNDSSRANNTFAITSLSGTGCTPNSSNPSINGYGITNLSADSGSLDITISYKDGAGDTTSVTKTATYTKNKKAAPVLTLVIGNNNQSTDAKSTGEQVTSFSDSTLSVKEQYNGTNSNLTLSSAPTINSSSAFSGITKTTTNLSYPTLATATDSVELSITGSVTDSEGISRQVFGNVSLTKVKKAAPVLSISTTNKAQSVSAKSTGTQIDAFSNSTVTVSQTYNGSTTNLTITSLTATSSDIASISTTAASGLVTLNGKTLADGTNSTIVTISATVTDSEGSSRTLTDTITLSKVKKAPPTITFAITPSSQTVAANSAGTLTGTIVDPVLTAFEGSSALTYNQGTLSTSQFKITNVTGVTVGSTTPSTSTIDVTAISSTDNTGVVTIAYVDSEGTSGTSTIRFTISKAIAGAQGDPGNSGADGKRTATGMIHYQVAATSAPSAPTATSYTFSTGTFSGLTANWGLGAPTYASGNTNKYWYSTYSVVETTAGGGTGTPSFGTPTQAIGFSGLVSFTAANNVSDGSNALSFGVAGTTLINGSNISTGKITSTNYSAGSPYTTAGSIIDLDNGRIATKTFYVDSNGDAVFKGTLSAAGGTFAGQITVGGTNYNLSDTLNANTTATQVGLGNVSNLTPQNQAQTGLIAGTTITGGGITISGGGSIKGGQTNYNTGTGFFLGYHGSAYKFSIGDASTKGITWDGSTLSIGGDVTIGATLASTVVSNASSALSNAATAQSTANSAASAAAASLQPGQAATDVNNNTTTITGNKIRTGTILSSNHSGPANGSDFSAEGMAIDLTGGGISAKNFRITAAGSAFFKGDISGASGTFSGNLSGATISGGSITIGSNFSVDTSGNMLANNASMTGTVTATAGTIGGWSISNSSKLTGVGTAGQIVLDPAIPSIKFNNTNGATKLTVKTGPLTYLGGAGESVTMPSQATGAGTFYSSVFSQTVGNYSTTYFQSAGNYVGTPSFPSGNGANLYYTSPTFNGYFSINFTIEVKDSPNYNIGNTVGYISVGGDTTYGTPNETGVMQIIPSQTTLTLPNAGTYYFHPVRTISGNWTSGYVQMAGGGYTGGTSTFNPELDFGELTEYGLQVASSADQFVKIARGSSYALEAKGAIYVKSPNSSTFSYFDGVVHPYVGNTNDLGTTGNRWKTVWTNNALNSTSDARLKNSIEDTDLGLEFINGLRPVKYKNNWATSPRYHYGLIAQEMISTLDSFGKTTSDVGFIVSSSVNYTEDEIESFKSREDWKVYESEISASMRQELGLAYTELLSPMIKAIQELTTKIETLEAKISGSV